MKPNKLIIFDFDGVLRSVSWKNLYNAYVKLIEAVGKDPNLFFTDVESFSRWADMDWHKNEARIFGGEYVARPEFNKIFHAHYDPSITLFPWVPETLAKLSEKHTLAVLSSSTKASIKKELDRLDQFFSCITGAEEVSRLKPNPEGVLLTLKATDIPADEAIMIGDMSVDFFAGKSAGVKCGLVKWGLGEWEELRTLKPDYLFEEPEELLKL
jgi:phosphoglycolate phosphatase-like HAD superfamily hydrolase